MNQPRSDASLRSDLEQETPQTPPSDPCSPRDRDAPLNSNVIKYQRRIGQRLLIPAPGSEAEILYITDETPIPAIPPRRLPPAAASEEVFYIGPD